jgi:hypothetical protein
MLSRVVTATKTTTEVIAPLITNEISHAKPMSYFIVKNETPEQDTSKVGHKGVTKIECNSSDCNEVNCAKDNSICDPDTLSASFIGHLTQATASVEPERTKVELEDSIGPRGGPVTVVVYESKEEIHYENTYDNYSHNETTIIQKDSNTDALNKQTKEMPIHEKDNIE